MILQTQLAQKPSDVSPAMLEAKVWLIRTRLKRRSELKFWPKSMLPIITSMFYVRKKGIDSSQHIGHTSWCYWGSGLCNRAHITFITVKTGSPTKDPHSSAQTHRNAEKRGNILIRSCFLSGSWEGSIISCYASHLFYSMRTRDVPELVSLFPLRHVPRCHEKTMCDCCPGEKNPRLPWRYDGAQWLHYKVRGTCAKFQGS